MIYLLLYLHNFKYLLQVLQILNTFCLNLKLSTEFVVVNFIITEQNLLNIDDKSSF